MKSKKSFDFWLFTAFFILLAIGTIMVFSASGPTAYSNKGDTYFFLKKQLMVLPIGFFALFITMNFDYRKYGKLSFLLVIVSIILMLMVKVPGIGMTLNGARRWIKPGIEPSEIAKLAVILFFSYSLSKRKDSLKLFIGGFMPYILLVGVYAGILLFLQSHLSATIVITVVAFSILFSAGAKITHFVIIAIPALMGFVAAIVYEPYRLERIYAFLDPFKYKQDGGWQVINSLYAIGSGGWFGKGLGKSLQKYLYLPEPHNDFILAVLAEELGFIGVMVVILLFLIFIWRGIKISINAPDTFGSFVAIGITTLIAIQVIINIAVVSSSIPNTGMPLPFFSYGGTSLLFLMCEVGILLNISRYANYERI